MTLGSIDVQESPTAGGWDDAVCGGGLPVPVGVTVAVGIAVAVAVAVEVAVTVVGVVSRPVGGGRLFVGGQGEGGRLSSIEAIGPGWDGITGRCFSAV